MARYKWKTYASKKLNARYNNLEEPHKLNDHACDSLRYFMMSRPNLDAMFGSAMQEAAYTEAIDGAKAVRSGDFTVRSILAYEAEQRAQSREYVPNAEEDMMGGLW
jgi:hypothetical protein